MRFNLCSCYVESGCIGTQQTGNWLGIYHSGDKLHREKENNQSTLGNDKAKEKIQVSFKALLKVELTGVSYSLAVGVKERAVTAALLEGGLGPLWAGGAPCRPSVRETRTHWYSRKTSLKRHLQGRKKKRLE